MRKASCQYQEECLPHDDDGMNLNKTGLRESPEISSLRNFRWSEDRKKGNRPTGFLMERAMTAIVSSNSFLKFRILINKKTWHDNVAFGFVGEKWIPQNPDNLL